MSLVHTSNVSIEIEDYVFEDIIVENNVNITGGYFTKNGVNATPYILLRDEKSQGSNGGTFTSGAWRTRVINTEVIDTHNLCTLSSNQFTLLAGTYRIKSRAPAFVVDRHRSRLYNITTISQVLLSSSGYTDSTRNNLDYSTIVGQFTIGTTTTFEIQHYCQTTYNTFGFGVGTNFGGNEYFTEVELWRLY